MPSDADIVRCTSPWPGAAAQLLEGLAALGTGTWPTGHICSASGTTLAPGDAVQILSGLEITGICIRSDDGGTWRTDLNSAELQRLSETAMRRIDFLSSVSELLSQPAGSMLV